MRVSLEATGDRKGYTICVNGKSFTSNGCNSKALEELWMSVLEAKIFDVEDVESGIYNEDSEYPCSIMDVMVTQYRSDADGYEFNLDWG